MSQHDSTLLRSQRNDVFEALLSLGLKDHLHLFEWQIVEGHTKNLVSKLSCKQEKEFYFVFDISDNRNYLWSVHFFPDRYYKSSSKSCEDWQNVIYCCLEWSEILFKQIEPIDLWENIRNQKDFVELRNIDSNSNSEKFSEEEKIIIRHTLKYTEETINKEINPSSTVLRDIHDKFEYISNALDRLNKFDWKGLCIGIITSIVINMTVDTSTGHLLINIIRRTFSQSLLLLAGN